MVAGIELARHKDRQHPFPPEKKIGVQVIKEARRHDVMLRPLSDVIVLMPPLSISEQELTTLLGVVELSITTVAERLGDV
jgi:adenosylmethionine---8-amino-7-oxononanoate aminotransferase